MTVLSQEVRSSVPNELTSAYYFYPACLYVICAVNILFENSNIIHYISGFYFFREMKTKLMYCLFSVYFVNQPLHASVD